MKLTKILFISVILSFLLPSLVLAVCPGNTDCPPAGSSPDLQSSVMGQLNKAGENTGLSDKKDPREIVARIINALLGLLGTIFLVYIIYAGYLWMTAGGEEQKIQEAQKHLKNAVIGLVIILCAYAITRMVNQLLLKATVNKYYQTAPGEPEYWPQGGP